MKPEIDAAINEAVNEATDITTTSLIRNLMKNMNLDAEQAMKNLGINEKDFPTYLALI